MRRFLVRLLLFALLQAGIFRLIVWSPDLPRSTSFLAATLDKHRRLAELPSPKIVLVGGSNLAFSFQSDLLERESGLPVVNLGLVAGLGLSFVLSEAEGRLDRGDVVVLSLEYEMFRGGDHVPNHAQLLEIRPASLPYVPRRNWRRLIDRHGLAILGGCVQRGLGFPAAPDYTEAGDLLMGRRGFNRWGDYVAHEGRRSTLNLDVDDTTDPDWRGRGFEFQFPAESRERLARFVRRAEARGARVFFTCPPQPRELLARRAGLEDRVRTALSEVPGLEVLDAPADHAYPAVWFYDNPYHLYAAGAQERTWRVIRRLVPRLSE